jgi:L-seryl-tRNA(Ser) seleniumtransferase
LGEGVPEAADPRRSLPAVHRVLAAPALARLADVPTAMRREAAAAALARARSRLTAGAGPVPGPDELAAAAAADLEGRRRPSLRRVVNATGVVLHTNLGRAVLAPQAVAAAAEAASAYTNLEFDLGAGERGSRSAHVEDLLCQLTGAEAAYVVNNNAGAVFLFLRAMAQGREVVVSRGELVEIGGSFRVPDVMAESGARLVEVGTTNRTHRSDYERALGPETAGLFKAHPSNFRVRGFTAEVSPAELASLAHAHGLWAAMDLGSGLLVPTAGLDEPVVADLVASGLDAVMFSGDKLLGGPQCGVVAGRREVVEGGRRHPGARARRVDKMTLAALAATLALYRDGRATEVPTLAMLSLGEGELARRALALARTLRRELAGRAEVGVARHTSRAGGGSAPDAPLPTALVTVRPLAFSAHRLARRLRLGEPPVVARVWEDAVAVDPRTLLPGEARIVRERLRAALADEGEDT